MITAIREMLPADVERVVDYFVQATQDFLRGMGADKSKLPERANWIERIKHELDIPFDQKEIYYVIWQVDGRAIGHSNVNQIEFGKHASMHLHIWESKDRQGGNGLDLVRQTIPIYFDKFRLEKLICEPYALNPAPNRALEKVGFEFIRSYETIPGIICFHQLVNRYEMSRIRFDEVN
ncbi:MAG: GNAT family protein [Reichenbachiella sp.]|uniref:GNAT family N-acetyltransferase n=2 Tax=Reichenbachiella sp. TaxID=2184521 RepID=UPI0032669D62